MIQESLFRCEVCKGLYNVKDKAEACERQHSKLEQITILDAIFENCSDVQFDSLYHTRDLPKTLLVRGKHYLAYYVLESALPNAAKYDEVSKRIILPPYKIERKLL